MSNIAAVPGVSSVSTPSLGATTPNIQNIVIAAANTEQSFSIPDGSKFMTIKARGNGKLQVAYTATESGTKYITIWPGDERLFSNLTTSGLTVYVQCSKAGEVVEVESWS